MLCTSRGSAKKNDGKPYWLLLQFCEIFNDHVKQNTIKTHLFTKDVHILWIIEVHDFVGHILTFFLTQNISKPPISALLKTLFHPATWKTLDTLQEIVFSCLLGPIYGKQINPIKQV